MTDHTADSVLAMMARHLHAMRNSGFDGNEHPDEAKIMRAIVFNALYPITFEQLAGILNGTHVIESRAAASTTPRVMEVWDKSIPPDLSQIVIDWCIKLLAQGQKIEAIKYLREQTKCGLKEAKDYIEALPYPR